MGIENEGQAEAVRADADNSLPLMGIENVETMLLHGASGGISLPLMGIENRFVVGQVQECGGLITPHGDRKRAHSG